MTTSNDKVAPVVGLGATVCIGSDRYAATIVEVRNNGRTVVVKHDKATPDAGHDAYGRQSYTYATDADGSLTTFTLRQTGRYVERGGEHKFLRIGVRDTYMDPSF